MKLYQIIGSVALLLAGVTSCANHDPFGDRMDIGQILPTVYWEQNSTVVKAGTYATFKGQYYTSADHQIDRSEVWALTKREQSAQATCKLTSSLSYTKIFTLTDTVRQTSIMGTYAHSKAEWDGYEYTLTDSFPTSRTLGPVSWVEPAEWDQEKFDSYYPATFQQEFVDYVVNALTKDSTYIADLRRVYINYDFPKSIFEQLNAKYNLDIPTDTATADKSDRWFVTETDEVDHYYYTTVVDGVTIIHEIQNESDAPSGANVYPVYKSSPWLLCRYSDDTGGKITSVRREYMPYWKDLISTIPFTAWIYNTADKVYAVEYSRTYFLEPEFRVIDEKGKVGVTTDNKEITLN